MSNLPRYSTKARCVLAAIGIAALAGTEVGAQVQSSKPPATIKSNMILQPLFKIKNKKDVCAGKIFAATLPDGGVFLLTCAHLFAMDDKPLTGAQIADSCTGVSLLSLDGSSIVGSAGPELLKNGKPSDLEKGDCSGDLVAFRSSKTVLTPVAFETSPVKAGTRVWVITKESDSPGTAQQVIGGKVTDASAKIVDVKMDRKVMIRATSGSPVVNQNGKLIGILIGGAGQSIFLHPAITMLTQLKADGLTK